MNGFFLLSITSVKLVANERMAKMHTAIKDYLDKVPVARKESFLELRNTLITNLPEGYAEELSYGMIGYVVPHTIYPAGYHCNPKLPLPFISIASQKNYIVLYHMGLYADKKLYAWFLEEYGNQAKHKPDMGKSCIRFKKPELIPMRLIGELAQKMSVREWVYLYEHHLKR